MIPYGRDHTRVEDPEYDDYLQSVLSEAGSSNSHPAAWDTPVSLGVQPPPLPADTLGEVAGPMVTAVAASFQTPTDMAVGTALSLVTTAAAGRWMVQVSQDWVENLALATCTAAASGERKSGVQRALSAALRQLEAEQRRESGPRIARAEAEYEMAGKRVENLGKVATKPGATKYEQLEYLDAKAALAETVVERPPCWLVADATLEAMASVMADQGGALGVLDTEPGVFKIMAGRYSKDGAANVEFVLKATSGDEVRVHRKGSDPILIPNPCLSMALCIQTALLQDLGSNAFRDSGLLARFLFSMPAPQVGSRTTTETPIPADVAQKWEANLRALALTASKLKQAGEPIIRLALSAGARTRLNEFRDAIEPRLHPQTGDLAAVSDWGSKLPGTSVRIAAALELLADAGLGVDVPGEISEEVMADAIRLATAYIPHALAAFSRIHGRDNHLQAARDVLAWLCRKPQAEFTLNAVHQGLRGRAWVTRADDIRDALRVLADYGHVRLVEEPREPGKSGRPTELFELHPMYVTAAMPGTAA